MAAASRGPDLTATNYQPAEEQLYSEWPSYYFRNENSFTPTRTRWVSRVITSHVRTLTDTAAGVTTDREITPLVTIPPWRHRVCHPALRRRVSGHLPPFTPTRTRWVSRVITSHVRTLTDTAAGVTTDREITPLVTIPPWRHRVCHPALRRRVSGHLPPYLRRPTSLCRHAVKRKPTRASQPNTGHCPATTGQWLVYLSDTQSELIIRPIWTLVMRRVIMRGPCAKQCSALEDVLTIPLSKWPHLK